MRALIQRVTSASVSVEGKVVGEIGSGLSVFLGIKTGDDIADADYLARKITSLRIFPDNTGKNDLSLVDINGELLIVSQFTLYAQTRRGNRPSYSDAASANLAKPLYDHFVQACKSMCGNVQTGTFQAHMQVCLYNDGPITILCTSES